MNVNVQIADIWPEWEVIDEIGSGYYGRVYSIKRSDYIGTYYAAMKVISIPKEQAEIDFLLGSGMDERSVTEYLHDYADKICREIALMEELKGNTNIVSYEDHKVVWRSDGTGCNIYIRMQLLTPLLTYIKTHNMLTDDILQLGCDICHALELCEKKENSASGYQAGKYFYFQ